MVVRVVFVWVSLRGTDMGLLYVPVCSYSCVSSWECMQVQGMLPSPPHPPTHPQPKGMCVCVQLGMCASLRYVTIPTPPTHPPQPKGMCVCVCSWECMQVQGMLPSPPHPPTHPPQRYVCVHVCTDESPKNTLCVQMSQICVLLL